jgi:uncharacterized surface protein with fasciclin (FAS1) repeats
MMKNSLTRKFAQFLAAGVAVLALTLGASNAAVAGQQKDIVDTAIEAGSFQTLAKALNSAGRVVTLKGE